MDARVGCHQLQAGRAVAMRGWGSDAGHPSSRQGWPQQPKGANPAVSGQARLWDELTPACPIRQGSRRNRGEGRDAAALRWLRGYKNLIFCSVLEKFFPGQP